MKIFFFKIFKQIIPPIIWNAIKRITRSSESNGYQNINYQGVRTEHNMLKMHKGRFHDISQKYWNLDPNYDNNITRLRHYYLCFFSNYVKNLEGDFITAGISFRAQ